MKIFAFLFWIVVLLVAAGVLFAELPDFSTIDGTWYLLLMVVLISISVTGALMEYPYVLKRYRFRA